MKDCMTTFTGLQFNAFEPEADKIRIEDIAHALSMLCRGNGHVSSFWSVGEHCICCAKEAAGRGISKKVVLACLLHDASECYMSDVPRPLKQNMKDYKQQESRLLDVIYRKFLGEALTEEEEKQIKAIDDDLLWYDLEMLLGEKQDREKPELHIRLDYKVRPFDMVEREYLDFFRELSSELESKV